MNYETYLKTFSFSGTTAGPTSQLYYLPNGASHVLEIAAPASMGNNRCCEISPVEGNTLQSTEVIESAVFSCSVRCLICPLRERKFITLLTSVVERIFFFADVVILEVRIHDIHTTVLHYIND